MTTTTAFTTTGRDLLRALEVTKGAAARRPSMPCLAGTLIRTTADGVTLTQFDYTTVVMVELDTTHVTPDLNLLIHRDTLVATLKALRSTVTAKTADAMPVSLVLSADGPALEFGGYTMPLEALPADEYPTLPAPPEAVARFDTAEYTNALARVTPAAGTDDTLPMLIGAHLRIDKDGSARLEATDRYRFAIAPLTPQGNAMPGSYLLPAKILTSVAKHLSGGTVEFLSDEHSVASGPKVFYGRGGLRADGITLVTQDIGTEYITLGDSMAATATQGSITVSRTELAKALKTVGKLTRTTVLRTHGTGLEVAPYNALPGRRATAPHLDAEFSGEPHAERLVTVAYLADAVRAFTSDRITLHHAPGRCMVLTTEGEQPDDVSVYRHLVMGLREC